jgi:hypothetical protein
MAEGMVVQRKRLKTITREKGSAHSAHATRHHGAVRICGVPYSTAHDAFLKFNPPLGELRHWFWHSLTVLKPNFCGVPIRIHCVDLDVTTQIVDLGHLKHYVYSQ